MSLDTAQVSDVIAEISAGAKEQSAGISQVNAAVGEMDSVTQQNAALVQQSTTAAQTMAQNAARLRELINGFVLDGAQSQSVTPPTQPSLRPSPPIVAPSSRALRTSTPSSTSAALSAPSGRQRLAATEEEWEEF